MARAWKWIVIAVVLAAALVGGVLWTLHRWLATDDFRQRVEREASQALGVPLSFGALTIDAWPLPAIAADGLRIASNPPITLARVEVRPRWQPLLRGRLEIATLVVRDAVLPQQGIAAVAAAMQRKQGAAASPSPASASADALAWVPRRMLLENITWVDAQGARMKGGARTDLGDDGLLDEASFKLTEGKFAGAQGRVARGAGHWDVQLDVGGGRVEGPLTLEPAAEGARLLSGTLTARDVEVSALTAPSRTLTGKLESRTTLRALFRDPGQIGDAMQTQTQFTVRHAVVHGLDLAQAVKTVGLSRGGETRLDTLAGQVSTQGKTVHLSNLVASSGALAATGNVTMAPNKSLSGRVDVQLTASRGTLGVPLSVGGTLDSPSVSLTRSALVGAAIGTLVAPGVGTGAGATVVDKLGEKLKGLFGR